MPKIKMTDDERLVFMIKNGMAVYGISKQEMAVAMRKDERTLYTRFKKPGSFTLQELNAIAKKLNMKTSELLGGAV